MATVNKTTKNDRIYVRVNESIKDDFEIVAHHRGLNPAALLHSLIVKTIHEQRELTPQIFDKKTVAGEDSQTKKESPEKISVTAKTKAKNTKETKKTLSTRGGEIPLVDEAPSAADEE